MLSTNNSTFASRIDSLPPSDVAAEEEVIGGILLDADALPIVQKILPPEAFYASTHQTIYKACLDLKSQGRFVDISTVTSYLKDKNLLEKVGGTYGIARIVERTVSAITVEPLANLVLDKYQRREVIRVSNEMLQLGYSTEIPLTEVLKEAQDKALAIAAHRHHNNFEEARAEARLQQITRELEEVEAIPDKFKKELAFRDLAKRYNAKSVKEFADIHAQWLRSRQKARSYTIDEYLDVHGNKTPRWLLESWIPEWTITVLHAFGGVGKTTLINTLCKCLLTGEAWGGYEVRQGNPIKILWIQTDQGATTTIQLLDRQGMFALSPEIKERQRILDKWAIEDYATLERELEQHQYDLVVVDSLSSVSSELIYRENDQEFARPFIRLRHIAEKHRTAFLVLHHSSRAGNMRGTTAIYNAADQVWKLERVQKDSETLANLTIEKSRHREDKKTYRLEFDLENHAWISIGQVTGEGEREIVEDAISPPLKLVRDYLRNHAEIGFESEDLARHLDIAHPTCRKLLAQGLSQGLLSSFRGSRKRALYFIGSLDLDKTKEFWRRRQAIDSAILVNPVLAGLEPAIKKPCDRSHEGSESTVPISDTEQNGILPIHFEDSELLPDYKTTKDPSLCNGIATFTKFQIGDRILDTKSGRIGKVTSAKLMDSDFNPWYSLVVAWEDGSLGHIASWSVKPVEPSLQSKMYPLSTVLTDPTDLTDPTVVDQPETIDLERVSGDEKLTDPIDPIDPVIFEDKDEKVADQLDQTDQRIRKPSGKALSISFAKTVQQLKSGQKSVTRRVWKDSHARNFIRYFETQTKIAAFDKDRRSPGAKCLGFLILTEKPYKERLVDMPPADLAAEGFPELSRQEFIDEFFDGDAQQEVWVVRFAFTSNAESPITEPSIVLSDEDTGVKQSEGNCNEGTVVNAVHDDENAPAATIDAENAPTDAATPAENNQPPQHRPFKAGDRAICAAPGKSGEGIVIKVHLVPYSIDLLLDDCTKRLKQRPWEYRLVPSDKNPILATSLKAEYFVEILRSATQEEVIEALEKCPRHHTKKYACIQKWHARLTTPITAFCRGHKATFYYNPVTDGLRGNVSHESGMTSLPIDLPDWSFEPKLLLSWLRDNVEAYEKENGINADE